MSEILFRRLYWRYEERTVGRILIQQQALFVYSSLLAVCGISCGQNFRGASAELLLFNTQLALKIIF